MHATPIPGTVRARGTLWQASAEVAGRIFRTQSRSSAPSALARMLVEAGIEDQPVELTSDAVSSTTIRRVPRHMWFPSLHQMAGRTIEESATVPVRDAPFRKIDASVRTSRPKQGVKHD